MTRKYSLPFLEGAEFVAARVEQRSKGSNGYVIRLSTPKSQLNKNHDRDLSDCESESVFAGAGDKRAGLR